jgi:hypothetical protein
MAHWAELDANNTVIRVLVGDNNDPNGDEGYQWLLDNLGGTWVKTSYNGTFRKRFAGVGDKYDDELDAFIPAQPYPSWTLDRATALWKAPVARPAGNYAWNEPSVNWVLVEGE